MEGKFHVPEDKLESLKTCIKQAYSQSRISVKCLASVVGIIISITLAIGSLSRLRTRALYTAINSRHSCCDNIVLPQNAREELKFWFRNVDSCKGSLYGSVLVSHDSDASDSVAMEVAWWN